MKLTSIVFCLALLGGALTSCIDEDIDDCFSINRLTLSYKGDGTTEIFPDKICRVEMYVFDAENKFVNSHTLSDDELASRTALLPPLKAGDTGSSAWETPITREWRASPLVTLTK